MIVAKPYGLGIANKDSNYHKVEKLKKKFFTQFYEILNQHHGTKYSERFWQIVLGHWFNLFVNLIFKNVNTLNLCLNTYDISGTTCYKCDQYSLATRNYSDAILALDDLRWNDLLTAKIFELLDKNNFKIEFFNEKYEFNDFPGFKGYKTNNRNSLKSKILKFGRKSYNLVSNKFVKKNDAFIINSYLPLREEIKLELSLGQWPQMWKRLEYKIEKSPNQQLRKKLTSKILKKSDDNLENALSFLLFELLPVCYLEGFTDLQKITEKLPWPKSPKFIFTSNNFHTDEIFKLWSAIKVERGTKYYIGQHGNNYFIKKNHHTVEEKNADKFITWGWNNGSTNYKPGFIFNTAGKKKNNYDSNGELLLVETTLNLRLVTWDTYSEFKEYFRDQKKFVSYLSDTVKKKLNVKLYPGFKNKSFREDKRWLEFDPTLKICKENSNIWDLIQKSRLVVHSYDSTGILETLSLNIPTLAFWQNDFDHLKEDVRADYQMLADVGIIHLSPKSAANKINDIWNDIDSWWNNSDTQNARRKFCDKFAKDCNHPAQTLTSLLIDK